MRAPTHWWALGLLAVLAPTLIAAHDPPSVTFYNQALAVLGWGLFVAALGAATSPPPMRTMRHQARGIHAIGAVLLLMALCAAWSGVLGTLPGGLALMGCGMSMAAWLVLRSGWRHGLGVWRDQVSLVFFSALTAAGVVGMVLALIQVFHPAWADGLFIAATTMVGRAVGNLRQPNHFSTLLVFACAGVAWLGGRRRLPVGTAVSLLVLFIFGIVLTASRTGMLGMIFLTAWGVCDKRLPKALRLALTAAPLIYGACWGGMWWWSQSDKSVAFAAETRLHDHSDISSSRFKIWANVWELIKLHPWTGVGYGEFNVAWTLTPFPTRPVAFFDHTHNLILQWAVELGLPLTVLMLGLSGWGVVSLLKPDQTACQAETPIGTVGATAVIVGIAGLHSLLEYPLWYSYFLLPTAFAWGLGLAARHGHAPAVASTTSVLPAAGQGQPQTAKAQLAGGVIMALLAIWCALDYQAAANIYAPRPGAGPLDKRIAFGQKMPWWGYQADYADVTTPDEDEPSKPPQAFARTLHNLLDARLMIAYARSLAEHDQVDKARYVVQRLKEFNNPMGTDFLAVCKDPVAPGEEAPFQCTPPLQTYSWRDVLPQP
jgi:O-antigen ligase